MVWCDEGKPFYEANVWVKNGVGDPLLLEFFPTRREAIACVRAFKKAYTGGKPLDCYVNKFDEEANWEAVWDI